MSELPKEEFNNTPKHYDPSELVLDFLNKVEIVLTQDKFNLLTLVVEEAFSDGFCRGYNKALKDVGNQMKLPELKEEWWSEQDKDEKWEKEHTDPNIEELLQYCQQIHPELLDSVRTLVDGIEVDLDLPLNPWDEVDEEEEDK